MFWIYLVAVLVMYSLTRKAFVGICLGVLISIVLVIAGSFVGF